MMNLRPATKMTHEEYMAIDLPAYIDEHCSDYEREFIFEYFKDQCASRAVRRMTLSKDMSGGATGYFILNRPHVAIVVEAFRKQKLASLGLTPERILTELSAIAMASVDHYLKWTGNSILFNSMEEIPEELRPAIKALKSIPQKDGSRRIEVELHDKIKALELAGRFHTMWKDKIDVDANVKTGGVLRVPAAMSPEEWEKSGG